MAYDRCCSEATAVAGTLSAAAAAAAATTTGSAPSHTTAPEHPLKPKKATDTNGAPPPKPLVAHSPNGPFDCPDSSLKSVLPGPFYMWSSRKELNPAQASASIDVVVNALKRHSPVDGLIGFSQGSVIVAILEALASEGRIPRLWKFCVFMCCPGLSSVVVDSAGSPNDDAGVDKRLADQIVEKFTAVFPDEMRRLPGLRSGEGGEEGKPTWRINAPSFHVMGKEDTILEESQGFFSICEPSGRRQYTHSKGHIVPFNDLGLVDAFHAFLLPFVFP
ncbi:serine hydrolase-domain-containing protein [Zopfochytrium polystomum]|nr:serine hydrolase-domain-containing protein [Zopfochytrium polystomum]